MNDLRSSRFTPCTPDVGKGFEVSAMKVMMDELGLVGGKVRPPLLMELRPDELGTLRATLPKWKTVI